jgi:hypothetical protein
MRALSNPHVQVVSVADANTLIGQNATAILPEELKADYIGGRLVVRKAQLFDYLGGDRAKLKPEYISDEMTASEFGTMVGVSRNTIYELTNRGKIPFVGPDTRRRYTKESLLALIPESDIRHWDKDWKLLVAHARANQASGGRANKIPPGQNPIGDKNPFIRPATKTMPEPEPEPEPEPIEAEPEFVIDFSDMIAVARLVRLCENIQEQNEHIIAVNEALLRSFDIEVPAR